MQTKQADELLQMWQKMDNAIKLVETSSTSNLSARIAAMMEVRKDMDNHVMELSIAIFKQTL